MLAKSLLTKPQRLWNRNLKTTADAEMIGNHNRAADVLPTFPRANANAANNS
jgi:hypothetical protein